MRKGYFSVWNVYAHWSVTEPTFGPNKPNVCLKPIVKNIQDFLVQNAVLKATFLPALVDTRCLRRGPTSIFDASASPSHVRPSCIAFINFIKDTIEYKLSITSYTKFNVNWLKSVKKAKYIQNKSLVWTDLPCVCLWGFARVVRLELELS